MKNATTMIWVINLETIIGITSMEQTIKTDTIFVCRECGCKDGYLIPSHPSIIECVKCGHPNDLSWDIEYPEEL